MVQLGLEALLEDSRRDLGGKNIGYLSNQASTDRLLRHGRLLLHARYGERLTALYSPQHGFYSEKQDNMIESAHGFDPHTSCPVYSLYGDHRKPTGEMLAPVDVLLIDLVDVGTRVYTFVWTLVYCLEAAAEHGKKIVVLDRPNPIGGLGVEGNMLKDEWRSFVGLYSLPMRHGMTLGELALLINKECSIGAELEVIPAAGWRRHMLFQHLQLPWVLPSPNMPSWHTAAVYPGQVIWEGTNVSEGRGTTLPFEFVGAPFWRHEEMAREVGRTHLPGCTLRPVVFEPTSGKWAGKPCTGFQIHLTDLLEFRPYRTSLALYQASYRLYPEQFQYKQPPYEYEFERLPMDLILGDQEVRKGIESGVAIEQLEAGWQKELAAFTSLRQDYLLYS